MRMTLRWPLLQPISRAWLSSRWLLWVVLIVSLCSHTVHAVTKAQLASLRKETEDLFYHGYENYMKHAFPEDELRPISCRPLTRDSENPAHFEINDALGNYSLTLIDSLSTLAVLASSPSSTRRNKPLSLFQNGVKDLIEQYGDGTSGETGIGKRGRGFDLDSKVQVFETAIRGLGGLLSAHLFAVGDLPITGYTPPPQQVFYAKLWRKNNHTQSKGIRWKNGLDYDGQLLRLAHDLGQRLLPAFWTQTGIPYPRVNLRHGIPFYSQSPLNFDPEDGQCDVQQQGSGEVTETCSAGAGSLTVEFAVLSRLTGDPRFEELAKRAFWAIWSRRSELGLIGSGIDAETGDWIGSWTGIGAGVDSFFEYAFKSYVLLSRDAHPRYELPPNARDPRSLHEPLNVQENASASFYAAWHEAHASIIRHLYRGSHYQHPHYIQVDMDTGAARGFWQDALSAYYPGLLAQAGFLDEAIETHLLQTALWARFSALPERWNLITGGIEGGLGWWVGRPEFIESTYHIYRATEDPWYIYVGEMVLRDIKRRCWSRCGWASIQNVLTGEKSDRMESFFLGETAKYLFLLFDPDHPLNHLDGPMVFSTEGHPLMIPAKLVGGQEHEVGWKVAVGNPGTCPPKAEAVPFTISSTAARSDVYKAAALVRLHLMPSRNNVESVLGEYAADHPSITYADISSPSNYTYYPWTLPPTLVPHNATSAAMKTKPTFDISFPVMPNQSGQPVPPLQRIKEGILVNNIGGLKLGMIQDVPTIIEDVDSDGYRIQAINNLLLGKDERVFLSRDMIHGTLNPTDPNFTRIRDAIMLDIVIDVGNTRIAIDTNTTTTSETMLNMPELDPSADSSIKAAWNLILSHLSSMVKEPNTITIPNGATLSLNDIGTALQKGNRFQVPATTAVGKGATILPDWPDAVLQPSLTNPQTKPQALQFHSVYAAGYLCDDKLPLSIPRTNQIILVKRGGCSFNHKLANIPTYLPTPTSLQLVIMVSYDDEENSGDPADGGLIRPLLNEQQVTSSGLVRHNPIPMILTSGGEQVYQALKHAEGIGIKRRYEMRTQGIPITNLIIV